MEISERPSYLKAAFANVYNLSLLGGAAAVSLLTGDYIVGALAVGLEAMWLLFVPDLAPFKRWVDREHRAEQDKKDRERVAKLMESLPEREWQRAHALDELRREIERDMQQNPTFQAILLQPELDKMSALHSQFVGLATACVRAETYLSATDSRDLQRQKEIQNHLVETLTDAAAQDIARKNVQVLDKRLETMKEIQNFLARARGQMNLIENSVRLLRDQILTMSSPSQLGEQLDDLLTGVEAIQASAKEADLYSAISLEPIAPISSEQQAEPAQAGRVRG